MHKAKALVINCMDFRLQTGVREFLVKELNLLDNYDYVGIAGVAQNLVNPRAPFCKDLLLEQIELSVKLHDVDQIILINHTDCGAYGGHFPEEKEKHSEDLKKAKEIILGFLQEKNLKTPEIRLFLYQMEENLFTEVKS